MDNLKFYSISNRYFNYIRQFDNRISAHNSVDGSIYLGIVLNVNNHNYFVPLTSYSYEKETRMRKRSRLILRIFERGNNDNRLGYILFNNMIPVPLSEINSIDISDITIKKNAMMNKQYIYINSIKEQIHNKAEVVYRSRIRNNNDYFNRWCCDFKLLEDKSAKFMN